MIIPVADRLSDVSEYYFVRKLEEIKTLEASGAKVISFAIGSPDMEPSPATLQALAEAVQNPSSHGYPPFKGIPKLRENIAAWYRRTYNVSLDPATEVQPLLGSKEGILHISMAFLNPGDGVILPNPGYPTYTSVSKLVQARLLYYDLTEANGYQPNIAQLDALADQGAKLMWMNYPHMPTGAAANPAKLQEVVSWAKRRGILLCYDNPYSLVLNEGPPMSLLAVPGAKDVAIELNSLSKSFNMAGWRVGILAGRADYVAAVSRVKSNIDSGMFLPIQIAAAHALENDTDWHDNRNSVYAVRRQWVMKILELLGCAYDKHQTGMFVWAKAPAGIVDVEAWTDEILYKKHIFFTPGKIFGSNGDGYIRISLCIDVKKIEEALDRLKV